MGMTKRVRERQNKPINKQWNISTEWHKHKTPFTEKHNQTDQKLTATNDGGMTQNKEDEGRRQRLCSSVRTQRRGRVLRFKWRKFLSLHLNCWVHKQYCWLHLATPSCATPNTLNVDPYTSLSMPFPFAFSFHAWLVGDTSLLLPFKGIFLLFLCTSDHGHKYSHSFH